MKNLPNIIKKLDFFYLKIELYYNDKNILKKKPYTPAKWQNSKKEKPLTVKDANCLSLIMGQKFDKNKYIICIDVDDKADEMSGTILIKNGLEYFNNLCKENEYEPLTTLTEKTQGGGYHYYFYVDEETLNELGGNKNGLNIGENVKVSIDYKTRNDFIICAPSKVKFEGQKYKYKWISENVSIDSIQNLPLLLKNTNFTEY